MYSPDFPITSISLAQHGISLLPKLLVDIWPSLTLLASFAAFVLYNGGVVLGTSPHHALSTNTILTSFRDRR
jgi:DIE2/ALG10 family